MSRELEAFLATEDLDETEGAAIRGPRRERGTRPAHRRLPSRDRSGRVSQTRIYDRLAMPEGFWV
jgi:hypothetical protein